MDGVVMPFDTLAGGSWRPRPSDSSHGLPNQLLTPGLARISSHLLHLFILLLKMVLGFVSTGSSLVNKKGISLANYSVTLVFVPCNMNPETGHWNTTT